MVEKKSIGIMTVIVISIVVAVLVSVTTASITGNFIKQNNNAYGAYKIYTTSEIDTKLNSVSIAMVRNKTLIEDSIRPLKSDMLGVKEEVGRICAKYFELTNGVTIHPSITDKSYWIDISYLGSSTVKLKLNAIDTPSLEEGASYKLSDGNVVSIKKISFNVQNPSTNKVGFVINAC